MSRLDELIQELCPNGVEYKPLKEISIQLKGMSGVSRKWENDGNCQFIDYMNAYKNLKINIRELPYATVKNLNQTTLQQGDILFTSASETPDECAISSVIEEKIDSGIFIDDHLFGIRINKEYQEDINATYLNYYFRSPSFRKSVNKTVRGVTRFYISKVDFMNLLVPVPPMEVQSEIVRILDNFTLLTAELTAELTARKKQYEYYKSNILSFSENVPLYTLEEISSIYDSLHQTPIYSNQGYPMVRVTDIKGGYINIKSALKVDENTFKLFTKKYKPKFNDIIISRVGSYGNFCLVGEEEVCLGQNTSIIHPTDVNPTFLYYVLHSNIVTDFVEQNIGGGSQKTLSLSKIKQIPIPVPTLEEQERIVSILDRFDALCNDISIGLPAEIEARKKQYEYYRDKLLTFRHCEEC